MLSHRWLGNRVQICGMLEDLQAWKEQQIITRWNRSKNGVLLRRRRSFVWGVALCSALSFGEKGGTMVHCPFSMQSKCLSPLLSRITGVYRRPPCMRLSATVFFRCLSCIDLMSCVTPLVILVAWVGPSRLLANCTCASLSLIANIIYKLDMFECSSQFGFCKSYEKVQTTVGLLELSSPEHFIWRGANIPYWLYFVVVCDRHSMAFFQAGRQRSSWAAGKFLNTGLSSWLRSISKRIGVGFQVLI